MEQKTYTPPEWNIDKTHPQYHNDLIEALSGITDPELGFTILDLGLVRNISIEDNEVKVLMILTSPFCPYGPTMLEATRTKVEKTLGMKTTMEYGQQMWDPSLMNRDLTDTDWGLYPN
ncbi:MAG: iron-sulfur cluster assembly protein [Anaerolineaceae bacterium]